MAFFGFLAAAGSVFGVLVLIGGVFGASGAPQQAAAAAVAIALAVLPYVFFRVLQLSSQAAELKAIRVALQARPEVPHSGDVEHPRAVKIPTSAVPQSPRVGPREWAFLITGIMAIVIGVIVVKTFKLA